jgi:GNAT superfamily N-acetyltransferase
MDQHWLTISMADSDRFGLRIIRGRVEETLPAPGILQTQIIDLKADIAIIRFPAGITAPLYDLVDRGFTPIHADTLVYYARDLELPIAASNFVSPPEIELANQGDRNQVANLARRAFSSYRSHYHANRLLDPSLVVEGSASGRETWVARRNGPIIAFATCNTCPIDKSVEIVLNAVDPDYAGRGVYGYLINQILLRYRSRNFNRVRISTQIWNYASQKHGRALDL